MKKTLAVLGWCAWLAASGSTTAQQPSVSPALPPSGLPAAATGSAGEAAAGSGETQFVLSDAVSPRVNADAMGISSPAPRLSPIGENWTRCDNSVACSNTCGGAIPLRSEGCFDEFISPISNPVFFEDPRNVTEARFIFLNHTVPAGVGGGDVQLYALQLRARLSENVSLIATKDGFGTSSNPLLDDGWADIAAGLKFALLRNPHAQSLLSGGFTFEVPTGSARMLQGNGDGELNVFLTGGTQLQCRNYWISTTGFRLPMNHDDESQVWYWSNHLSHKLTRRLYALTEFNWYHWMRAGTNGVPGVEGLDLFNLGSSGVAGNDIVTQAVGVKYKPHRRSEIGVAYEFPLTQRKDILENRLNFNWIFRY